MPYIKTEQREHLEEAIASLQSVIANIQNNDVEFDPGVWNYTITRMIHLHILNSKGGVSYTKMNAITGMLECVKLELYRQVVSPYEDIKQKENGNVSALDS